VDKLDLVLDHFRQNLVTWRDAAHVKLEVAAIDGRGAWRLLNALQQADAVKPGVRSYIERGNLHVAPDVLAWVEAYRRGDYLAFPPSLLSPHCPEDLRRSSQIAQAILSCIRELNLSRDGLMALYHSRLGNFDESDGFNFWTIAQHETDYWLGTFLTALSVATTRLNVAARQALASNLNAILDEYPLRPIDADVSIADIESVLSLPIWKKRYELYSVWIVTEIVRALRGTISTYITRTDGWSSRSARRWSPPSILRPRRSG
jgi:hypothetical protein